MKKPLNTLSKTALAAVFATSALVPTAAVQADENIEEYALMNVVFEKEGQYLTLPVEQYLEAYVFGELDETEVPNHTQFGSGKVYSIDEYLQAYIFNEKEDASTYEELVESASELDKKMVEGKIVNGFVVAVDEQPEDRLNETFFYNVA